MPIGRSREERELNALLSKTLVQKDVMEPMEKIGWRPGTPPPPDYSTPNGNGQPGAEGAPGQAAPLATPAGNGQPATTTSTASVTTSPPSADTPSMSDLIAILESTKNPETGLYLNKYKTLEEGIKGSGHLANMAKTAFSREAQAIARLGELEAENLRLRQTPANFAAPQPAQPAPPSRETLDAAQARLDKVLSDIAENGGILDMEATKLLSKAQREMADAAADVRVQEMFASKTNQEDASNAEWNRVDTYMKENHPDAERFSEEVALYVQSNPLLAKAVNALLKGEDRLGATELAWTSFRDAHGAKVTAETQAKDQAKEDELAAREQVRKEQLEAARRDAGVARGSVGGSGVHEGGGLRGSAEEIEAARNRMRLEGEAPGSPGATAFRRMIIGPSLDPSIFGPQ